MTKIKISKMKQIIFKELSLKQAKLKKKRFLVGDSLAVNECRDSFFFSYSPYIKGVRLE